MPLKAFFGGGKNKNAASNGGAKDDKEMRGQHVKVDTFAVVIDSKIAEGGFAIVYKVLTEERRARTMALKRQFVADDDRRQLAACKRECEIVRTFGAHKNVITFYAASMKAHSAGVRDYLLLTDFYQSSVLALMNARVSSNTWLTSAEVLAITTDMCEAVACLHHARNPIWHADLKVENILIDSGKPPNYILCDFGSANTTTLTTRTQSHAEVEEHILKYTTLAYRAPEMIDLFAGHDIGIATDVWALGVMLYKLCYFSLPFGESTLAIQNGTFTFPENPPFPREVRALIRYMLEPDVVHRPNIAQLAAVAFALRRRANVVKNVHNSPMHSVEQVVALLAYHEAGNSATGEHPLARRAPTTEASETKTTTGTLIETETKSTTGTLIEPETTTTPRSANNETIATSIAPRIRPKATKLQMGASPMLNRASARHTKGESRTSLESPDRAPPPPSSTITHSSSFTKPTDLGFTDLTDEHMSSASSLMAPSASSRGGRFERTASGTSQHRRNYSDTSALRFPPDDDATPTVVSSTTCGASTSSSGSGIAASSAKLDYFPPPDEFDPRARSAVDLTRTPVKPTAAAPRERRAAPAHKVPDWNPFNDAPFVGGESAQLPPPVVTDSHAHRIFNPEHQHHHHRTQRTSLIGATIMETDPFGAAPFRTTSSARVVAQPCQSSSSSQLTLRDGSSNGSLTDTQLQHAQVLSPNARVGEVELQPTRSRYRQLHEGVADTSLPSNANASGDEATSSSSSSDDDVVGHPPAVHAHYIPKHGRANSSDEDARKTKMTVSHVADEPSIDEANLLEEEDSPSENGAPPVPQHRTKGGGGGRRAVGGAFVNTSFQEGTDSDRQ